MSDKIKIRKANSTDAEGLKKIMLEAYVVYRELLDGEKIPPMEADYQLEIRDYPTWVLEYEEEIIGGLIMSFDQKNAHLMNVAISPKHKGKGFGARLIQYAERLSKGTDCKTISLVTHIKFDANIRYYNKMGYTEIDRDKNKVYFEKHL